MTARRRADRLAGAAARVRRRGGRRLALRGGRGRGRPGGRPRLAPGRAVRGAGHGDAARRQPGAALVGRAGSRAPGSTGGRWSSQRLSLTAGGPTRVAERRGRLPPLAGPTVLPDVETFDPAVADAVTGERRDLPADAPTAWSNGARSAGVRRVDAVMRASRSARTVATSRGFRADWQETSCSIDLWADEIAGAAYGRRCLPSARRSRPARRRGRDAGAAPRLGRRPAADGARRPVHAGRRSTSCSAGLLLPNLSGRAIRDGRSPFSRADLEARRQIVRADLDLVVDTTLPFELATAPCSSEGVPAGRVTLIAGGRLVSPLLDLATAADLGCRRRRPRVADRQCCSRAPCRRSTSTRRWRCSATGVVVRDLPGLHTQQARRSRLRAGRSQTRRWSSAGRRAGAAPCGWPADCCDHLRQPSTRLVRIPGDLSVGLLVLTGVELLPA